jgi:hypothetical protein
MNYSIWPIEGTRDHLRWPGRLRRGLGESEVETREFGMDASASARTDAVCIQGLPVSGRFGEATTRIGERRAKILRVHVVR